MNEITFKLTTEQYALMQKLLEPYVVLSVTLNSQYKAQTELFAGQKLDPKKPEDLEEIKERG